MLGITEIVRFRVQRKGGYMDIILRIEAISSVSSCSEKILIISKPSKFTG